MRKLCCWNKRAVCGPEFGIFAFGKNDSSAVCDNSLREKLCFQVSSGAALQSALLERKIAKQMPAGALGVRVIARHYDKKQKFCVGLPLFSFDLV